MAVKRTDPARGRVGDVRRAHGADGDVTHAADRGEEEEIDSERDREGSRLLSKGEEGSPRAVGGVCNGHASPE